MSTLETALLVLQLLIAFALIAVILFQRTAQDGGGLVGGGSTMGGLFTARGSANVLTRTTSFLAAAFILNSLALGYITSSAHQNHSVFDQVQIPAAEKPVAPEAAAPVVPVPPAVPTGMPMERAVTSPAAATPTQNMAPSVPPSGMAPSMPIPITPEAPKVEPNLPSVPEATEPEPEGK